MKDARQNPSYSLRISTALREQAREEASKNRRSLNAEFGLLIEEGFKWREQQAAQVKAGA